MDNETMAAIASWSPILFMLIIFYFLLYRPQKKARQEREDMLNSLKIGVEVVTVGGVFGKIVEIDEENMRLEIANNVRVKVARAAVSSIVTNDKAEI